jgi:hypothetical protein
MGLLKKFDNLLFVTVNEAITHCEHFEDDKGNFSFCFSF